MLGNRQEKRPYHEAVSPQEEPRFSEWGWLRVRPLNTAAVMFVMKWFLGPFFMYAAPVVAVIALFPGSQIAFGAACFVFFLCGLAHLAWYSVQVAKFTR